MYSSACIGNMNEYPYSGLVHRNSHHSSQLISIFYMKVSHHSTSNTSLNCVLRTSYHYYRKLGFNFKKLPVIRIIDEIIGVIKEFYEIDRYTKNLISRVNHVLRMLVNLPLAIRYGPERSDGTNLMVLVKGLPTYTCCIDIRFKQISSYTESENSFKFQRSSIQSYFLKLWS